MGHSWVRVMWIKLALMAAVSIALLWPGAPAAAHELRPAIADVRVQEDKLVVRIELALESLLAGIDLSAIDDTDEAPNAARYDAFRAMGPDQIDAELQAAWPSLQEGFIAKAGSMALRLALDDAQIPKVGDIDLVRDSVLVLSADLPEDGTELRIGWAPRNGALVIREDGAGENAYSALLEGGDLSAPLPRRAHDGGGFGAGMLRLLFGD